MTAQNDKAGAGKRPHTLIYVHGHGFKPAAADLGALCRKAIAFGLQRDRPKQLKLFEAAAKEMAYYGDLNHQILSAAGQGYDEILDLRDRQQALKDLKNLDKAKKFTLARYDRLPGKTTLKEFAADLAAPLLKGVGLSQLVIGKLIPELGCYWQVDHVYHRSLKGQVVARLRSALSRGDNTMVISHGMGAIVVYDALWQLTHDPDSAAQLGNAKVESWITLGSPLGNETVRSKLAGGGEKAERRYPGNVVRWNNVAAEDDYLSHDKTVADDFAAMLKYRMVSAIRDYKVYNLAVHYGKSDPHSSIGYLVHPRVVGLIADWLSSPDIAD